MAWYPVQQPKFRHPTGSYDPSLLCRAQNTSEGQRFCDIDRFEACVSVNHCFGGNCGGTKEQLALSNFIQCFESPANYTVEKYGMQCVESSKLDGTAIQSCYNDKKRAMAAAAQVKQVFDDRVGSEECWPWVLIGNSSSALNCDLSWASHFQDTICSAYTGAKPTGCTDRK